MDMCPPHVDDYQFLHSSFHHPQCQLQQCYDYHDHEIDFHPSDKFHEKVLICRNPNLAKCGGEAQHLEKLGIWSPPGLPNV